MSPQPNPLLQQLLPAIVIPDGTFGNKEADKKVRLIYETMATAFQRLQNLVNTDPRMSDTRIAHGLTTQQGDVMFDYATLPQPGQVPFAVDGGRRAVWNSATSGGVTPVVTPHNLLSATHPDTLVAAAAQGYLIKGNSTPVWARFGPGSALQLLRVNAAGTDLEWFTLSLAAAGGWTDDGTIVRLTTNTDQVGIGTTTPGALLGLVNVNDVADILLKITGKASQSGDYLRFLSSAAKTRVRVSSEGYLFLGDSTDNTLKAIIYMGTDVGTTGNYNAPNAVLTWGDNSNALSDPATTADMIGCAGARFYPFKDATGQFDVCYGQSASEAWVLVSDESIPYAFYTGRHPSAPFLRASWAGNGDLTNYGKIRSRKSISAASKGIPGIELEETGAGTDVIALRAPATVASGTRVQLMQDLTGTHVLVGDDPPAVASRALGKVDLTGQSAAIGSTNLSSSAPAGMYLIDYTLLVTTLDATAGTIQFQVNYTDTLGATNQAGAALALTATGRQSGQFVVQLASGEISYQTNLVTVGGGAERYAIYVRVVALG